MGNKRLEWISVSSLILAISAGIVFGTISIGSQSKKADSPKKTRPSRRKTKTKIQKNTKKMILIMIVPTPTASMKEAQEVIAVM